MAITFIKNEKLENHCTFQIGGPADYFFIAKNTEELKIAIVEAKNQKLPILFIGGGSNMLISDTGWRGLALKINNSYIKEKEGNLFEVGAGTLLSEMVFKTAEKSLGGLSWAAGIPGTIGGAIFGNAGAYGKSISDSIISVSALDLKKDEIKTFSKEECQFDYRESFFKKHPELLIVSAILRFEIEKQETIKEEIKNILQQRASKIPKWPSAGSFFKNIPTNNLTREILENIPDEAKKGGKIAAGWLIEQCGLKGKKVGGAEISEMHANFIINKQNASSSEILKIIKECKESVKEKFKIILEEEVRLIGF